MYILLDVRYLSVFHANQTPVCLGPHLSVGWVGPDEHVKATDRSETVLHQWILFVIYVPCLSLLCCFVC